MIRLRDYRQPKLAKADRRKIGAKTRLKQPGLVFFEIRKMILDRVTTRNQKAKLFNRILSAKIIKIFRLDSGVSDLDSKTFSFSANDLTNGKYKVSHGLNTKALDVTVIDHLGKEIEVTSQVDTTFVEIDLNRCTITNNWTLLVEK
jgi:hypothetical protein